MENENALSGEQGIDIEKLSKNIIAETTTQKQCYLSLNAELYTSKMRWDVVPLSDGDHKPQSQRVLRPVPSLENPGCVA